MYRRTRDIFRLCIMLLLGALIVTAPIGSVAQTQPAAKNSVNGAYRLLFAGYVTGRGTAAVGQKRVVIIGQVTDEAGASGNFRAQCPRNGNYFSGAGTAPGGATVTVKGRLDPSNKSLRAARLTCTYIVSNAKAGRIAGDLKGG